MSVKLTVLMRGFSILPTHKGVLSAMTLFFIVCVVNLPAYMSVCHAHEGPTELRRGHWVS